MRASFVSSRADAQTEFVAFTRRLFLSPQGATRAASCTETDKPCWDRNLCDRRTPPCSPAPALCTHSILQSHQCPLSFPGYPGETGSGLGLLSPDITPNSSCAPPEGWGEQQKPSLSVLHKFLCLCTKHLASSTRRSTSVIATAMQNEKKKKKKWNFSVWFSPLHLRKEHILPLGHSEQAQNWLPIQIRVGYPQELQPAPRTRLQGGGDCVKNCSLFLGEEVSWLLAISKTHYLLALKSTWKLIRERNAQYRAGIEGKNHLCKLFSRQSLHISFHYAAYFSGIHFECIF